jgi:hypothetical protein
MQPATDPTSLNRLHDIVVPAPLSLWWPLAPGWWVVITLVILLGGIIGYILWKKWQANAYRRAAVKELNQMTDVNLLPQLLKRTALSVYPRETVAALTGEKWIAFLNASASRAIFTKSIGEKLLSLSYQPHEMNETEKQDVLTAAEKWIMGHGPFVEASPSE